MIRRCCLTIFALIPCLAASAVDQVDRWIPAEAEIAVVIRDVPALYERWNASPLATLWADPAMRSYFGPLHETLAEADLGGTFIEETGLTIDEFVALFPGGIAFYFEDLLAFDDVVDQPDASSISSEVPLVILAGAGDQSEDLEALMLDLEEREAENRDEDSAFIDEIREYRDITTHIERRIDTEEPEDRESWAMVDDTLVFAMNPDALQVVIDRILDETADPLLAADKASGSGLDSGDAFVYLDLEPLIPLMEKGMQNNPAGLDAEVVMRAVGLDALRSAHAVISIGEDATSLDLGLRIAEDVGIFRVLAFQNTPLTRVEGIPRRLSNLSVTHFDFQASWNAVETMMNAINPMYLAMGAGQFNGWQEANGLQLDLERDLLENLGTRFVGVQVPTESSGPVTDVLMILDIKDRQGLERMIESLKAGLSQGSEFFESRTYLGTTIHSAKKIAETSGDTQFAYALSDQALYVSMGPGRSLEDTLAVRNDPEAPSGWDSDEIQRALSSVSGPVASFSYQNPADWIESLVQILTVMQTASEDSEVHVVDPESDPPTEVVTEYLGPMVSTLTKDSTGFGLRIWILPAEDGNR